MRGENFVAVYTTRANAERARDSLRRAGVDDADLRLSADAATQSTAATTGNPLAPRRDEGFFDWLFGSHEELPERDRSWFGSNLRDGRTALSVHVSGRVDGARIIAILEEHDPIDIDDESWRGASSSAGLRVETASGDRVNPGVTRGLETATREDEKRYRVRSYAAARPGEDGNADRSAAGDKPGAAAASADAGTLGEKLDATGRGGPSGPTGEPSLSKRMSRTGRDEHAPLPPRTDDR